MTSLNHRREDVAFRVRGKPTRYLMISQHHGRISPRQNKVNGIPMVIVDA